MVWLAGEIWVDFEIFKITSLAFFMAFNEVRIVLPMHISWFSQVKLCVLEVHKIWASCFLSRSLYYVHTYKSFILRIIK